MTITSSRLSASDEAEFVFVVVCSVVVVRAAKLLSLLHLLVVLVERVVSILDDERVHHCNGRGSAKTVALCITLLALLLVWGAESTRLHR